MLSRAMQPTRCAPLHELAGSMVERLLQLPEGSPKVLGLDLQLDKHGAIWLLEVPHSALCLSQAS